MQPTAIVRYTTDLQEPVEEDKPQVVVEKVEGEAAAEEAEGGEGG